MINNIDINKIVVSNELPFGKEDLIYFNGYQDNKKLELYVYFFRNKYISKIFW